MGLSKEHADAVRSTWELVKADVTKNGVAFFL